MPQSSLILTQGSLTLSQVFLTTLFGFYLKACKPYTAGLAENITGFYSPLNLTQVCVILSQVCLTLSQVC